MRRVIPLLSSAAACGAARAARGAATNITMYHVHPKNYTGVGDMNTGDAAGDAYFDLNLIAEHINCLNTSSPHIGIDCGSPEQEPGVVLSRHLVEVYGPINDTGYAQCVLCKDGWLPPFHHEVHCTDGDYVCICDAGPPSYGKHEDACAAPVGRWRPTAHLGPKPSGPTARYANGTKPDYNFWQGNLIQVLDGAWYSTLNASLCDGRNDDTCTWRLVETQKRIDAACHKREMQKTAEGLAPGCFASCPDPTDKKSHCWAECFFTALFGPDAGRSLDARRMTEDQIVALWTGPFDVCPDA